MSSNKAKHDPLEAAKITAETMKQDDQKAQQSKWPTAPQPGKQPTPAAAQSVVPVVAQATVDSNVVQEKPVVPPPKMYKVLETKKVSFRGNVTTLVAGDVISEQGYGGAPGIERLRESIKLEEV